MSNRTLTQIIINNFTSIFPQMKTEISSYHSDLFFGDFPSLVFVIVKYAYANVYRLPKINSKAKTSRTTQNSYNEIWWNNKILFRFQIQSSLKRFNPLNHLKSVKPIEPQEPVKLLKPHEPFRTIKLLNFKTILKSDLKVTNNESLI